MQLFQLKYIRKKIRCYNLHLHKTVRKYHKTNINSNEQMLRKLYLRLIPI